MRSLSTAIHGAETAMTKKTLELVRSAATALGGIVPGEEQVPSPPAKPGQSLKERRSAAFDLKEVLFLCLDAGFSGLFVPCWEGLGWNPV